MKTWLSKSHRDGILDSFGALLRMFPESHRDDILDVYSFVKYICYPYLKCRPDGTQMILNHQYYLKFRPYGTHLAILSQALDLIKQ